MTNRRVRAGSQFLRQRPGVPAHPERHVGQHGRRDTGDHGRTAQMGNKTLIREHFHVLRGSRPDSRSFATNHGRILGSPTRMQAERPVTKSWRSSPVQTKGGE